MPVRHSSNWVPHIPWTTQVHSFLSNFLLLSIGLTLLDLSAADVPSSYRVAMRDGTDLATDVYLPDDEGPWPVILLRFPYNKAMAAGIGPDANRRGYVFVAQDTRGRFGSKGANLPFDADGQADGQWDGLDTVRWIIDQPWSNGRIGTWGGSAGAITQYFLAGTSVPEVKSQHLVVGAPSLFQESIYRGGIFRKAMVEDWLKGTGYSSNALPLWTTNYPYTDYWKAREITSHYERVQAAGLHIGGWFDIFAQATLDAFLGYQTSNHGAVARQQRLIMGPWTHGILTETAGELTFPQGKSPPNDVQDAWKWFDATLKISDAAVQTALQEFPVVTYYVMGAVGEPDAPGNEWRTAPAWPPIETRPQPLYLNLDGSASFQPSGKVGIREYVSDPNNPVPTIGGYELTLPAGPKDQGTIESREDLLVFSTAPLESPLEVTGHIHAELWIQSDAPDTDVIVRICDVYPDGRSFNICEGTLRMRLREGLDRELSMPKDKPVRVQIRLWPTSQIFNQGHQLRVHIASTSFPALEPNLQNGNPPRTGGPKVATNRIYLGGNILASHLILPVADNSIPFKAATELGK